MSIGWPEVVVLLIIAMGIGVTTLVVLSIGVVLLRQRGRRLRQDDGPTDDDARDETP